MEETALPDETDAMMPPSVAASVPLAAARERCRRSFERASVVALLREHDGNITAAARAAGVDRTSLHRLSSRCGIRPRRVES